ncbi:hypothetical protein H5410_029967 [Solanum commersonii]|uniref:Uncharacterized protein n=1 Tax=Solanum commersonii TaxID=4109 RepID=A0A9J5YES4_SOLCO|nr:hypothetical protein H5410_029967 [Solanum commersonii]
MVYINTYINSVSVKTRGWRGTPTGLNRSAPGHVEPHEKAASTFGAHVVHGLFIGLDISGSYLHGTVENSRRKV